MQYISHSVSDTEEFGCRLAGQLRPNTVVACRGGLGMGKTPLFHFDMYRLDDSDALFDIGWEDYLDRGGVCVVEWSENVADALPPDAVVVTIARGEGDNERIITVEGGGIA